MEHTEQSSCAVKGSVPEVLRLNNQDLDRYLRDRELENPMITLLDKREERTDRQADMRRKLEWLDGMDEQNRVYYEEDLEDEEDREEWNIPVEQSESLADFVFSQLAPACADRREQEILWDLASSLDENGYLTEPLEAFRRRYGLREVELYRYLYRLQSVEPAGVGAGSLTECLLIQLDRLQEDTTIARRIVMECLEWMSEGRELQIATYFGISLEKVNQSIRTIRRLNPRPGSGFSTRENLRYVLPDVNVVKFRGYFQVLLNDTAYPKLRMDRYYMGLLKDRETPPDTRSYLERQLQMAKDVEQNIRLRGEILTRVTRGLVTLQLEFFEKGPAYRKNISTAEAAAQLELEEEVLSAAVSDKYMQCSWGVYPMHCFFMSGGSADAGPGDPDGGRMTRQMIRRIIAEEDKSHPLSDRRISEKLMELGIELSRRTVAKYRTAMGIPETGNRRSWNTEGNEP